MRAVLLGLISLCKHVSKQHVRVQCDNTTAIAHINAMGGIKSKESDNLAKQIWEWCLAQDVWFSACHIPECGGRFLSRCLQTLQGDGEVLI
jgi:hypothetical protein